MANPIEKWKAEKHGFDVWPDVERYAREQTPMKQIDSADLERMKWHGVFYRKRDEPGRYMSRIRITAGELTAAQAREIAFLAYEYGHGIVDITTRANLQVQGLAIEHVPAVIKRLARVGLTSKQTGHDNIRNVFGHPYSGLLPDELIDTRALCHEVTALFVDSREYADLPRKMNICFNGTDQHSAHFWTQDISYLATRTDDGEVLFHLLLAGTQGQNPHLAWHVPVLVAPDQVVDVTQSILDLFRAKGSREKRNAARLCFLVKEIGIAGVLDWLTETLPFPLRPSHVEPVPAASHDELVGWFRQQDGQLWTQGLSVPLGRMSWRQLEGLAILSKKWGDGQLRVTHEQGIAIANIPTGFKDAAATGAAALGLSSDADALEKNTVACTGSQFCNIAVTETKGQMLLLMEKLRKKALKLHGIRIHMSGCPSSCAQHFTADIGLKGVRVRRLLGTREGFDVFLGGGIAGRVHMGLPYKLGVDADQLPTLIEEVVNEYYQHHRVGQTFSMFWRERLQSQQADKVGDDDYQAPVWLCEACEYEHQGEDPPVFCPQCAGLRRNFARLDDELCATREAPSVESNSPPPERTDGFVPVAADADLTAAEGLTVEVQGRELALFRIDGQVHAIDSECPHEGAPLAQGTIENGVVTCPWHNWTFNACTGCSIEPAGNDVQRYETKVEDGQILVRVEPAGSAAAASNGMSPAKTSLVRPADATLALTEIIEESADVRTFHFDNRDGQIALDLPGRFLKLCLPVAGEEVWRSFTISSCPTAPEQLELTIKRNPAGTLTPVLFDQVRVGDRLRVKGPHGGFCFDPLKHENPLALVSAGSGITPMLSIARYLKATGSKLPCTFLYGARQAADILFREQCEALASTWPGFKYQVTLSQPEESWSGACGRIDAGFVLDHVADPVSHRWFLCGPNEFMDSLRAALIAAGVDAGQVHTEQFHATPPVASTS